MGIPVVGAGGSGVIVKSPFWMITYIYFGFEVLIVALSIISPIKLSRTNKALKRENGDQAASFQVEIRGKEQERELRRSGRLVKKMKLGWMYGPDKLENWLEQMEEQGYHLYRINKLGVMFYFTKGSPRKVRYVADYQNLSDETYFNIHMDAGWKREFHSFSSFQKWTIWSKVYHEGEEKPQFYSDKTNHLKHAKKVAITYTVMFVPIMLMYCFNFWSYSTWAMENNTWKLNMFNTVVYFIAIVMFGTYTVRTWLYFMRLRNEGS